MRDTREMPFDKTVPFGAPSFIELGAPDGTVSRRFFGTLFGWSSMDMEAGSSCAQTPSLRVGMHPYDADACMVVYFAVADIKAAAAQVRALGGTANDPGTVEPGFGALIECRDPQGVRFGLHQQER